MGLHLATRSTLYLAGSMVCAATIVATFPAPAVGIETSSPVVKVVEDWELVIDSPDTDSGGPQVACVTSPVGDVDSLHLAFELNHRTLPDYEIGGLQLQFWQGETVMAVAPALGCSCLSYPDERVSWKQVLSVKDEGQLTCSIEEASSQSCGNFAADGRLSVTLDTSLENLNSYSPHVAVDESGVSYAAHRVKSLLLKRVRYYLADGNIIEDDTDRVIHTH